MSPEAIGVALFLSWVLWILYVACTVDDDDL